MSQKLTSRWRRPNRERPIPRYTVSLIVSDPLLPPEPTFRDLEDLVPEERDDEGHREQDGHARERGAVEVRDVQEGRADTVCHQRRREQACRRLQVRRKEGDRGEDAPEEGEDP